MHHEEIARRNFMIGGATAVAAFARPAWAAGAEVADPQPFFASVKRALDALRDGGQPIPGADEERLARLAGQGDVAAVAAADAILDRYTLARVTLGPDGVGVAALGGAERMLVEQGWTSFLVRVANPHAVTAAFETAPRGGAGRMSSSRPSLEQKAALLDTLSKAPLVEKLWYQAQMRASQPLSGTGVEYKVVDLFSRDAGVRRARLGFGAGTINRGGRQGSAAAVAPLDNPLDFDFSARATGDVGLSILDSDGRGCMASLVIRDANAHVHPPQTMRLAPDMSFHPHVYRADGETVRLPDGVYQVTAWRGPEYLRRTQTVRLTDRSRRIAVRLERWIDPAAWGWYSGDTHLHAAGCSHYMQPTEGVTPETMIRHVRGEALAIGEVLTWGPAWYHQKQFFIGHAVSPEAGLEYPELQAANNASLKPVATPKDGESLLRYDIEVSQFPSSLNGHLVLLRLKDQSYPGTSVIEDWPSWNLPILKWGREQGAVVGYAHCGLGMGVRSKQLPNYEIPPFNSAGTNEAIVDVTYGVCDFLSGGEFDPADELNAWYHMLNCGYRVAMVGETDYPCLSDERPGVGRSYVQLSRRPVDDAGYDSWVEGIRAGRLYCGDGRSHFLKVAVEGRSLGETVRLARSGVVAVRATIAARLEPEPTDETRAIRAGWHLERARIGATRTVPLELVVNGRVVERVELLADGRPRPVSFDTRIARSSWVALRILPSGHTHPVFVEVGGKPIRASRRSAQWLRECVDALWNEKHRLIRDSERPDAAGAYDHARRAYDRIIAESDEA